MDIQRLRNLTTGRLHTQMDHVYQDLELLTGEPGIMTHMIRVMRAVEPWLRDHIKEGRFWDGEFDTEHIGEIDLPTPSAEDRKAMFERFAAMPNPSAGKDVMAVIV